MYYLKTQDTYLGEILDMANKPVDGFYIKDTIHIIWNIHSEKEYIEILPLTEILNDLDKYLWTPFALFGAMANSRNYKEKLSIG